MKYNFARGCGDHVRFVFYLCVESLHVREIMYTMIFLKKKLKTQECKALYQRIKAKICVSS